MKLASSYSRPMRPYRTNYDQTARADHIIVELLRHAITAELTRFAAAATPEMKLLDVGCGRQPFRQLTESFGVSYFGHDAIQNLDNTVDFVCPIDGPLESQLALAAPFDIILCTEVLEHVADWRRAFLNIATLLKPGGKLLITCPHYYVLHEEPFDYWRPTIYALEYFLEQAGLEAIEIRKLGTAWDVLGTIAGNLTVRPARMTLPKRLGTKLLEWCFNLLYRAVRSGWAANIASADCKTYLSNFAVATKGHARPETRPVP